MIPLGLFSPSFSDAAPLEVGAEAPTVLTVNQHGEPVNLGKELAEGISLVYFYPKADTPGCTKQACNLRDAFEEVKKAGHTKSSASPPIRRKNSSPLRPNFPSPSPCSPTKPGRSSPPSASRRTTGVSPPARASSSRTEKSSGVISRRTRQLRRKTPSPPRKRTDAAGSSLKPPLPDETQPAARRALSSRSS